MNKQAGQDVVVESINNIVEKNQKINKKNSISFINNITSVLVGEEGRVLTAFEVCFPNAPEREKRKAVDELTRARNIPSSSSRILPKVGNSDAIIFENDVGLDKRRRCEPKFTNPFAKKVDSQNHAWWQGYDCDFFSVRVKVTSIGELSQFYGLTCNSLIKYKDPRLHGCVAVTMDPIQLLAPIEQAKLLEAMRAQGITVFPNQNDRILSKTSGKRLHSGDLIKAFQNAGLEYVYAYGYGMKGTSIEFIRLLDRLCEEGGGIDNVFDIGKTESAAFVPVVKPISRDITKGFNRAASNFQSYPLFKMLGGGFGGVTFESYLKDKVQIYQRWTHWVKGSVDAKRKLLIPYTFGQVERFLRNYSILLKDLVSAFGHLGGSRIEITLTGETPTKCLKTFPKDQFKIEYWVQRGALDMKRISPKAILEACEEAVAEVARHGYTNRRNSNQLSYDQKAVFVDMLNLVGIRLPGVFSAQLGKTGNDAPPWTKWPRLAVVAPPPTPGDRMFHPRSMAESLRWRSALRGPGYTLTLARQNGRVWGEMWGADEKVNPEVDLNKFLIEMVKTVVNAGIRNWRVYFVCWETPQPLPDDFDEQVRRQNMPEWERRIMQLGGVRNILQDDQDSEDDVLIDFANTFDPMLTMGELRSDSIPVSDIIRLERPSESAPHVERPQPRQSQLPLQRVDSYPVLQQLERLQASGSAESRRRMVEVQSDSPDGEPLYPRWAVVSMSPELLKSVNRKGREVRLGNEVRVRKMHDGDDTVIMEFYYQVMKGNDPPERSPKGQLFWEELPRFCVFEPGSIANRWKGTKTKPGLASLYVDYKAKRDAESPVLLVEADYHISQLQ